MITLQDCVDVIDRFEVLPYFDKFSGRARANLAEFLFKLIGNQNLWWGSKFDTKSTQDSKGKWHYDDTRIGGHCFTPEERLKWVELFVTEDFGRWPEDGIAAIKSAYWMRFRGADGVEPRVYSDYTEVARDPMPPPAEKPLLPGPDDESIGDLVLQIEAAAEKMRGGK